MTIESKIRGMRLFVEICMLLFVGLACNGQKLAGGLCLAKRGGIVPKYAILEIYGETAQFELFTKWQGSWLSGLGGWDADYQPQILIRKKSGAYSNSQVSVGGDIRKVERSETRIAGNREK